MGFIDRLRAWFPANRIAAIAVFVAALATLLTDLAGAWPVDSDIAVAIIAAAALLTKLGVVLKFLEGSQQWDLLTTQAAVEPVDQVEYTEEDVKRYDVADKDEDAGPPRGMPQGLIRE